MKRIYLACITLLAAAVQQAGAQANIDSFYKTTYYEQKTTLFRLLPDTKGEIIFLGNSITDIGEWAEIWQNPKVKNRGISGDNTFGVLARLDEVLSSKPDKIFIMIGINDIAKGTPDSVIIANHKKIYGRIAKASPATKVYVQSILPTNADFTEFSRHQNKDGHVRYINEALKAICASNGLTYVDLYTRFLDKAGKLDKQYTNDGLHINGYGYMLWKQILQEKGYLK
ncbi:MAG TPA: GDSL-type esterase/lipase family protein [Flavisolibacter sp.]|nr:GDSL-type esterase/lipase family protein [Flavisolibacter sp.]